MVGEVGLIREAAGGGDAGDRLLTARQHRGGAAETQAALVCADGHAVSAPKNAGEVAGVEGDGIGEIRKGQNLVGSVMKHGSSAACVDRTGPGSGMVRQQIEQLGDVGLLIQGCCIVRFGESVQYTKAWACELFGWKALSGRIRMHTRAGQCLDGDNDVQRSDAA